MISGALSGVQNANELLRRVGAEDVLMLLSKLGFWVGGTQRGPEKAFPTDLSRMESSSLGDEAAYWQSELSRAVALAGALRGHKQTLDTKLKRVRSAATLAIVDGVPAGEKAPVSTVLAARVADRPEVREAEDALDALGSALVALDSVIVAYEGYARVISREISRRGDLLRARIER